jgi:hypothetical protein
MMSLRTHAFLDYIGGAILILSPFVSGFADLDIARNVTVLSGFILILYSLFTNYEGGMLKILPLGVHMTFDVILGAFIFMAPWILNYRDFLTLGQEYLHYALGIGAFLLVAFSHEKTEADRRSHRIILRQTKSHSI